MKNFIPCLIIVTLNSACWADLLSAAKAPAEKPIAEKPSPKKKIISKTATAVSHAITTAAIADVVNHKGSAAWLEKAIETKAGTALANALDDVVLSEALSPAVNAPSPSMGEGRDGGGDPKDVPPTPTLPHKGGGSSLPTLRAWAAGKLIQSSPLDVAVLGGVQTFRSVVSPVVAVRVQYPGSPWSLEAGAAIPEDVGGDFSHQEETSGAVRYAARVRSFYEVHLTANRELPHGEQRWVVPDAGFGVSMLHVSNRIDTVTTLTNQYAGVAYSYQMPGSYENRRLAFSPLLRIGVALFPDRLISLRSDVAYVGYGNAVTAAGQTFDLGFSGVMIRAALQVRL